MKAAIYTEFEILGSHGMQAHKYPLLLEMIEAGKLFPEKLVGKTIRLEDALDELIHMDRFGGTGVTVINEF